MVDEGNRKLLCSSQPDVIEDCTFNLLVNNSNDAMVKKQAVYLFPVFGVWQYCYRAAKDNPVYRGELRDIDDDEVLIGLNASPDSVDKVIRDQAYDDCEPLHQKIIQLIVAKHDGIGLVCFEYQKREEMVADQDEKGSFFDNLSCPSLSDFWLWKKLSSTSTKNKKDVEVSRPFNPSGKPKNYGTENSSNSQTHERTCPCVIL